MWFFSAFPGPTRVSTFFQWFACSLTLFPFFFFFFFYCWINGWASLLALLNTDMRMCGHWHFTGRALPLEKGVTLIKQNKSYWMLWPMQLSLCQTAWLWLKMRTLMKRLSTAWVGVCWNGQLLQWTIHYLYCQQYVFFFFLSKCRMKWKMLWELSGI